MLILTLGYYIVTLFRLSVRPFVRRSHLLSQIALTFYTLANWTLGFWLGVSCFLVKRFPKSSCSPKGQMIGKNDVFPKTTFLFEILLHFQQQTNHLFEYVSWCPKDAQKDFGNFKFVFVGLMVAKKLHFFLQPIRCQKRKHILQYPNNLLEYGWGRHIQVCSGYSFFHIYWLAKTVWFFGKKYGSQNSLTTLKVATLSLGIWYRLSYRCAISFWKF